MPSSMIFVSLVVLWLLILVPAIARRRQEVARPSVAALSGRVLPRSPRRHNQEVDGMGERDGTDATMDRAREVSVDDVVEDEHGGDRPPARYRVGRGGYDPEAAALAARARYAFRQRVVLALLLGALVTGIVAVVALPGVWWVHAAIDLVLVGYLAYLRRQVRMEEAIRARRAARLAGTRRLAEESEVDEWAEPEPAAAPEDYDEADDPIEPVAPPAHAPTPVVATPSVHEEDRPALPRLRPIPPPPLPAGTTIVEDEEAELDLGDPATPSYRRAVGQ